MRLLSPVIVWLIILTIVGFLPTWYAHRRGLLRRAYHLDVLAVALLALLTIGFFWRPIFETTAWIPAGTGGDMASMLYPNYSFIGNSLHNGELPLWNPLLFTGEPFLADIQTGVFYPINLLYWAFFSPVTYQSLEWLVMFHFFLTGLFTYIAVIGLATGNQKPIGRLAALAGAVAFMFSDVFITHIGNLNLIAVAAWMPLVFLFFHRALAERKFGFGVAAGVALAIAFFAGHIQPFMYIVIALAIYAVFHFWNVARSRKTRPELPRLIGILVVFAVITFGLMAVEYLPSSELASASVRSQITYETSTEYSLPTGQLISLFVPDFFGRGPNNYWGQWLRTETGYIGILPLILAVLALALRRERIAYIAVGIAILGLLLALGGSMLQGWLYEFMPGFDRVRAPARFIILFDFGVAMLAAMGLDALLKPLRKLERRVLTSGIRSLGILVALVAVVVVPFMLVNWQTNREQKEALLARVTNSTEGALMFALLLVCCLGLLIARRQVWARRSTIGLIAIVIIAYDVIGAGHDLEITTKDPTTNYQQANVLNFFAQDHDVFRVDTDTNIWDIWQPNTAPLYGLPEVQGARHPLLLASFHRYWSDLGSRSSAMYDLLNVKYIVGKKGVPLDFTKWKLAYDGDPTYSVYQNINVLPRTFVVHTSVVEPDLDAQVKTMQRSDFNPRQTVLIEQGQVLNQANATSTAAISRYHNNEVVITVEASASGYVFLGDMYYDGWKAQVDGKDAPLTRADYMFRAVPVEAGKHTVRMYYSPASFALGRNITIFTMFIVLIWIVVALVLSSRRRRAGELASPFDRLHLGSPVVKSGPEEAKEG
jgi:uncharacterized membrane protein YfhO